MKQKAKVEIKTCPPHGNSTQRHHTLSTVCVIETAMGDVQGATAYPDTPEGNKEAETRFIACIEENGGKRDHVKAYSPYFDADEVLEQGHWHNGDYAVFITHT